MINSANDVWQITTEGDEEGRTVRKLGVWEGDIGDLAFRFADQCYYTLKFRKIHIEHPMIPLRSETCSTTFITVQNENGSYLDSAQLQNILKLRYKTSPGRYYKSIKIIDMAFKSEEQRKREGILAKLTPDEQKFLGLK